MFKFLVSIIFTAIVLLPAILLCIDYYKAEKDEKNAKRRKSRSDRSK